ncbi:MAG: benzoyl-CoA 2,3-epoxidase subunit BoxA [Burkholderiaceae bacterium]|nr:benzoyl-CoA 2,3-epoxidase subunit BoxA [Burkholderiaceae bacterium]
MDTRTDTTLLKQHLIDPGICIRCNTCEETCPVNAITHDSRNYVVMAEICEDCRACVPGCPTGAIDNWRMVPTARAYALDEQFGWFELPEELTPAQLAESGAEVPDDAATAAGDAPQTLAQAEAALAVEPAGDGAFASPAAGSYTARTPPWSAAHAYVNLYGARAAQKTVTATCVGNVRVTEVGKDYDTHHVILDFGAMPFPVLEGQSIGVIPPGQDARGQPHFARQYSVASARNGERPGYNNVSLTIKRVLQDYEGNPVRGVASNFMCDLKVGDRVEVIGPFGSTFLMPNHPKSHIVMICTGTGSAPMRAMTEWRRRLRKSGKFEGGRLLLFFGARSKEELPYFGPLQSLPRDFIDIHFAFSRTPGQPKTYVQDRLRERAADLAPLLQDANCFFYVCGLKAMESGVMQALRDVAQGAGLNWTELSERLKKEGRLHLETY